MDVQTDWDHPQEIQEDVELNKKYKDTSMSFLTKLLIFSVIVFVAAIGIGAYLLFNGSNIVSANNIDININAPVSVAGGEPISFDVQVFNKNNVKLETVDLSVDYPAGTADPSDTSKELKGFRELIPDIDPPEVLLPEGVSVCLGPSVTFTLRESFLSLDLVFAVAAPPEVF